MPDQQLKLQGVPAPEPHSNRGRLFEGMLERTHDYYLRQNIGRVEKLPNAWVYCSEGEYNRLPDSMKARTADGRPLKRQKTSCDYIGTVLGRGVAIDAKEFAGPSIPLRNFESHQVRRLDLFSRVKSVAGFLIYSKRADAVFFLEAGFFSPIYHTGHVKSQNVHMGQVASLNVEWLRSNTTLVCERAGNDIVDWARVLIIGNPPRGGMSLAA